MRKGAAESLPWPEDSFDVALAQLVLHFLDDPVAGLVEMRRVVRPGGMVAACTWNFSEMLLLRIFWEAARSVVPAAPAETLEVASLEEFGEPWQASRPRRGRRRALDVSSRHQSFDELWDSFQLGVGPAGEFCASLDPETRDAVRDEYRRRIGDPEGSFTLDAQAWALRGRVPT